MQILKTKGLARFARRERIADKSLREAIERAAGGLVDADLVAVLSSSESPDRGRADQGAFA